MTNADVIGSLNPQARSLAWALLAQRPDVILVSGRRTLEQQASAMAGNVLERGNDWVARTYVPSPASKAVASFLAAQDECLDKPSLTAGLYGVLSGFAGAELRALSWHLDGDAFDAAPIGDAALIAIAEQLVADAILAGAHPHSRVVTLEDGMPRLHIQVADG